jgi:predicted PurR-regulated permease PerM
MTTSNRWFWLIFILVNGVLVYLLAPVLTPFIAAAILAYVADPLVDVLEKYKVPRTLGVAIVFIIFSLAAILTLLVLVPLLERQFIILGNKMPGYIDVIQNQFLPWINTRFNLGLQLDIASLKSSLQAHWKEAGGIAKTMVAYMTHSGALLASWLANLVLIPVVTFYLLRDWDILVARIREALPRKSEPVISRLAKSSDEVLSAFLRGQLMVMLALSVIYTIGLWFVGLDIALLIGMLAGLVSFVPYLGFIVGIVAAIIASLMQFHDIVHLIYVAIAFGVGQVMESMVLTPMLVGDRIGLHPVAVMFAVLAGGQLFGFLGVLLALPVAAVIAVILRYMHERYKESTLYSES